MSHIFISYSRRDLDFAQRIVDALAADNLDTWIDWKSIPKGEDWEQEIYRGIEEADAFLFLISPHSVASEMCNKEIARAVENGKRILPIFIANVDNREIYGVTDGFLQKKPREEINRRNFIICRKDRDDFDKAMGEIQETIHTDYEWLKYHTKLQVKALEWEKNKKDNSRLLRGRELREAQGQLSQVNNRTEPLPTSLQQTYIQASLKHEERLRKQTIAGVSIAVLAIIIISIIAWRQRTSSINAQKTAAAEANSRATAQANADQQTRIAFSRKLAAGAKSVLDGYPQESLLLSIEALNALEPGDPIVPNAEQSLRDALLQSGGIALGQGVSFGVAPVISADNHWLAAGNADGTIKLWDLTSPDPASAVTILPAQGNSIQAITITDDNQWLIAAGSESPIQLWELSNLTSESEPLSLSAGCSVYTMQASPDGHWLAIICGDDTVKIWDLTAHDPTVPPVTLPKNEITPEAGLFSPELGILSAEYGQLSGISPDSRWLAVATDNYVSLWDLNSTDLSAQPILLDGYNFPISILAFSPDGRWLAAADSKTILLWDLTASDPPTDPLTLADHFQLSTIAFTADGALLAAGTFDGAVRFWNLASADPSADYFDVAGQAPSMYALAFSPDQKWMVTAGGDVRLLDVSGWRTSLPPIILDGYENPVTSIRISPDSRWLVTLDNHTSLRLWDLSDPQPSVSPVTLWVHDGYGTVQAIGASPVNSRWLATVGGNGTALWDLAESDFQESPILLGSQAFDQVIISVDNRWLAGGGRDEALLLWDLGSIKTKREPITLTGGITAMAFSADSHWLASANTDPSLRLWNLTNLEDKPMTLTTSGGEIHSISFSADGRWLATVAEEDTQLWDLSAADFAPKSIGREFPIGSAVFSPDGRMLAVGRDDTRLLDLTTSDLKIISTQNGLGIPRAFSPDGHWLISQAYDLPQLLDLNTLIFTPLPGHEGRISGMAISPDSHWLASGSWDDTARIWDLTADDPSTTAVILNSPAAWLPHITTLAITADSHWLVTATEGGLIHLWTLDKEELIDLACKTAGRNLNQTEWGQYFTTPIQQTCPQWPIGQ